MSNTVVRMIGVVETEGNLAHIVPMKFNCDPNNHNAPFYPVRFDWYSHRLEISYINERNNNRVYRITETVADEV